jgi:hypothetical protein
VRERSAFLACILRLGGVIDRDRFGARGGELERIGRPLVPSPDRVTGLGLDLFYEASGDQLTRDFLRCGAFERWRGYETEVLALGCGAQQNEMRIGKFDGHGCTLRVFDWGLANPGPHRREPRIGAIAGAKGLPGSAFALPGYPYTRSFSNRMPVLSSLSGHEVNDIAQAAAGARLCPPKVEATRSNRVGCASPHCQGWGRGFESLRPRHLPTTPEQNWALLARYADTSLV